jgi:hypothetical protein
MEIICLSSLLILVSNICFVSSQLQPLSQPKDSVDDNIGTDLDGMKQLFTDVLDK